MLEDLPYLIMTDLDGSLLDHHDYSTAGADQLLQQLNAANVPIIFNTSKTLAELLPLRRQLKNELPFVIENGAAIVFPATITFPAHFSLSKPSVSDPRQEYVLSRTILDHQLLTFGTSRSQILSVLNVLATEFPQAWQSFNDWSVDDLVKQTGLTPIEAKLAMQRQFSEPLLWQGTEQQLIRFKYLLKQHQLKLVKGGRFYHVSGQHDKGDCIDFFKHYYQHCWQKTPIVVALGDGQNDAPMLENAEVPIVIHSPVNAAPKLNENTRARAYFTDAQGSQGWAEGIEKWLSSAAMQQQQLRQQI